MSVSIDDETLHELDDVQRKLGVKSRSKLLRNAVLHMLQEYETLDALSGNVESLFVLKYKTSEKNHVSDMLHMFEDSIRTELHQHSSGTCIDVLDIRADADKTRKLFAELKRSKCVRSVTCTVIGGGQTS
jgi:metal-responsive CopG/Arc/MetJ family transcriptional regulator